MRIVSLVAFLSLVVLNWLLVVQLTVVTFVLAHGWDDMTVSRATFTAEVLLMAVANSLAAIQVVKAVLNKGGVS